jgi:hypothetical protein
MEKELQELFDMEKILDAAYACRKRLKELKEEEWKLKNRLRAIQDICPHSEGIEVIWEGVGKCMICGRYSYFKEEPVFDVE